MRRWLIRLFYFLSVGLQWMAVYCLDIAQSIRDGEPVADIRKQRNQDMEK